MEVEIISTQTYEAHNPAFDQERAEYVQAQAAWERAVHSAEAAYGVAAEERRLAEEARREWRAKAADATDEEREKLGPEPLLPPKPTPPNHPPAPESPQEPPTQTLLKVTARGPDGEVVAIVGCEATKAEIAAGLKAEIESRGSTAVEAGEQITL